MIYFRKFTVGTEFGMSPTSILYFSPTTNSNISSTKHTHYLKKANLVEGTMLFTRKGVTLFFLTNEAC